MKPPFGERTTGALPAGKRVYAIGDIHGRLDLFETLLARIKRDSKDRGEADVELILLGDLVDRGADSAAMIARAMAWDDAFATLETLLGNHEQMMLESLDGDRDVLRTWLRNGGDETLQSYGISTSSLIGGQKQLIDEARAAIAESHLQWLAKRPLFVRRGTYFFVHAGIRPGIALDEQEPEDLIWIRKRFLDSRDDHGAIIVHGHSISREIDERPNRIGIDTGAFATGRLTAIGLEAEDRWFLQS